MRTTPTLRIAVAASGIVLTAGVLAGCSSDSGNDSSGASTSSAMAPMSSMAGSASASATALVGPGCDAYAKANPTGPGSVDGMAMAPVATAASNNPMLKTLTQAVSGQLNPQVNLVDTLNNGQYTVFAPTDEAFAKLDPATVERLKTDQALLTSILTYHVVSGQLAPNQVSGEHKTLDADKPVTVSGSGNDLTVGDASVVCGGVKTANATVYLIDSVLMPPN